MVVTYFRDRRFHEGGEEGREDHIIYHISVMPGIAIPPKVKIWRTHRKSHTGSKIQPTCCNEGGQRADEAMSCEVCCAMRE